MHDYVVHSYTATRHSAEVFDPRTGLPVAYTPLRATYAEARAQGERWCRLCDRQEVLQQPAFTRLRMR
jgi:hypothetical protein